MEAAGGSSSSNTKLKHVKFTSVGARKELPAIKKTSTVASSFTKTTLLTPTGIKKIQAIPIGVENNKKSPAKASKNTTVKKAQTPKATKSTIVSPRATKSTIVLPRKRPARSTKLTYVDSSDDSDEPLKKVAKKIPQTQKSVKKGLVVDKKTNNKKVVKTKSLSSYKKTTNKPNKRKTPTIKSKKISNWSTKTQKPTKTQKQAKPTPKNKSGYKKMIQKRTQRISNINTRVDYGYMSKKGVQNGNTGKKYVVSKKKFLQAKKQRKTLDDYLPLIRKYRNLIPENQPYVRVARLKFSAAHFTKERIRLTSDIDLFRDGSAFYGLLGHIFNHLDLAGKLRAVQVCRLWNRASNEDAAWNNVPLKNVVLHDLRPLERLILKRETKVILLDNVDIMGKAADYELCRLSCVKELIIQENSSPLLLNKLFLACNELENVVIPDTNLDGLSNLNIYVKSLNAENSIVSEYENRLLKTWSDLEKLVVHSFDPKFYYNMGLLLSLKYLKLKQLSITSNIAQFIENIPNIEYIEFTPEYFNINNVDGNKAIVESLKHCPSLKKLTWITVKEIEIEKEKIDIKPVKTIKEEETPVAEKVENDEISTVANKEEAQTHDELPNFLTTIQEMAKNEEAQTDEQLPESSTTIQETVPEKMEVDDSPQTVNLHLASTDVQMETDDVPQPIPQTQEDAKSLDNAVQEHVTQLEENADLFDFLKTTEATESSALPDKETESKITMADKEDKIKEDLDEIEEEDVKSVKDECKDELKFILSKFEIDSLQLLALKTYLKSSLPECEVTFKVIKKYNYID